jgi:hypothetical protein
VQFKKFSFFGFRELFNDEGLVLQTVDHKRFITFQRDVLHQLDRREVVSLQGCRIAMRIKSIARADDLWSIFNNDLS